MRAVSRFPLLAALVAGLSVAGAAAPASLSAAETGAKPLSQIERQKVLSTVQKLRQQARGQSGGAQSLMDPGGTSEDTYCCYQLSNGAYRCVPVDLLTICINSLKVECNASGCSIV